VMPSIARITRSDRQRVPDSPMAQVVFLRPMNVRARSPRTCLRLTEKASDRSTASLFFSTLDVSDGDSRVSDGYKRNRRLSSGAI
jgi:hypothetical protein